MLGNLKVISLIATPALLTTAVCCTLVLATARISVAERPSESESRPCCVISGRAAAVLSQVPKSPSGMVWVPAGEFTMGWDGSEGRYDESPAHRVSVDGFWMDATEVTNTQFQAFVETTGYVTTAERPVDWEELKKQLPPGIPSHRTTCCMAWSWSEPVQRAACCWWQSTQVSRPTNDTDSVYASGVVIDVPSGCRAHPRGKRDPTERRMVVTTTWHRSILLIIAGAIR